MSYQKHKENALPEYMEMINKSWTWARLTESERENFTDLADSLTNGDKSIVVVKGSYYTRWRILNAIYRAFLAGCVKTGVNCREPKPEGENHA